MRSAAILNHYIRKRIAFLNNAHKSGIIRSVSLDGFDYTFFILHLVNNGLFIILIYAEHRHAHLFPVTVVRQIMECIIKTVKLIGYSHVLAFDIFERDQGTGTIRRKYVSLIRRGGCVNLASAHIRQKCHIFELICRGIETNILRREVHAESRL